MSFKAVAWAAEQTKTTTSSQTLLLMILANFANEDFRAYPSLETLSKLTRLDKRTVRKCLIELQELGLIFDTGDKYKKQICVYYLNLLDDKVGDNGANLTVKGGTILHERGNNFAQGGYKNDTQSYYKPINKPIINPVSVNTHAHESENHDPLDNSNQQPTTVKNSNGFGEKPNTPAKKSKTKHSTAEQKPVDVKAYLAELGVSKQACDDFIDFRKQARRPLTITAVNRLVNEANKAGLTVEQAIEYALFKGWHSFSANYYHNSEQQPQLNQGQNYARQSYQHNHQQSETEQYAQSLQQQFNAKYNQPQAGRVVDADFLDLEKPF